MAFSRVVFKIEATTDLGEKVFVTGNSKELGEWKQETALLGTTTEGSYPVWSFGPVDIQSGTKLSYKFFKLGKGQATWEPFGGNREVDVEADSSLLLAHKFGDPQVTKTKVEGFDSDGEGVGSELNATAGGAKKKKRRKKKATNATPSPTPPEGSSSGAAITTSSTVAASQSQAAASNSPASGSGKDTEQKVTKAQTPVAPAQSAPKGVSKPAAEKVAPAKKPSAKEPTPAKSGEPVANEPPKEPAKPAAATASIAAKQTADKAALAKKPSIKEPVPAAAKQPSNGAVKLDSPVQTGEKAPAAGKPVVSSSSEPKQGSSQISEPAVKGDPDDEDDDSGTSAAAAKKKKKKKKKSGAAGQETGKDGAIPTDTVVVEAAPASAAVSDSRLASPVPVAKSSEPSPAAVSEAQPPVKLSEAPPADLPATSPEVTTPDASISDQKSTSTTEQNDQKGPAETAASEDTPTPEQPLVTLSPATPQHESSKVQITEQGNAVASEVVPATTDRAPVSSTAASAEEIQSQTPPATPVAAEGLQSSNVPATEPSTSTEKSENGVSENVTKEEISAALPTSQIETKEQSNIDESASSDVVASGPGEATAASASPESPATLPAPPEPTVQVEAKKEEAIPSTGTSELKVELSSVEGGAAKVEPVPSAVAEAPPAAVARELSSAAEDSGLFGFAKGLVHKLEQQLDDGLGKARELASANISETSDKSSILKLVDGLETKAHAALEQVAHQMDAAKPAVSQLADQAKEVATAGSHYVSDFSKQAASVVAGTTAGAAGLATSTGNGVDVKAGLGNLVHSLNLDKGISAMAAPAARVLDPDAPATDTTPLLPKGPPGEEKRAKCCGLF